MGKSEKGVESACSCWYWKGCFGGHGVGRKMNTLRSRENRYTKAVCVELGLEAHVCNLSTQEAGSGEL